MGSIGIIDGGREQRNFARETDRRLIALNLDSVSETTLARLKEIHRPQTDVLRRAVSLMDLATRRTESSLALDLVGRRSGSSPVGSVLDPELEPIAREVVAEPGAPATIALALSELERAQLSNLSLLTTSLVVPERKVEAGSLVRANTVMWEAIVDALRKDWSQAYVIPPEKFEELIAGAFERAGYDEVILTPRSGDDGRDVIALTRGVGCVKIIGSVKRYAKRRPVGYDDVRALQGVLLSEPDTSKGMIITTSSFPKDLPKNDHFRRFIPTRLELMDGEQTLQWLCELRRKS